MATPIDKRRFMSSGSKAQCVIAEKIASEIREIFCAYDEQIPLALAIGVLRIVEKEMLDEA